MPGIQQLLRELNMTIHHQQHKVTFVYGLVPQQECINNWAKVMQSALSPRGKVEVGSSGKQNPIKNDNCPLPPGWRSHF